MEGKNKTGKYPNGTTNVEGKSSVVLGALLPPLIRLYFAKMMTTTLINMFYRR
jgi:hypothetical protein